MESPLGFQTHRHSRRRLLRTALGASFLAAGLRPSAAAWFPPTPSQPAGPFYAPLRPLSIDNDLLFLPGSTQQATGEILHISGRVRDQSGKPITGARVEIWQANTYGR
jgi:protocatechuate 3,4-dioxygenase beta subunit